MSQFGFCINYLIVAVAAAAYRIDLAGLDLKFERLFVVDASLGRAVQCVLVGKLRLLRMRFYLKQIFNIFVLLLFCRDGVVGLAVLIRRVAQRFVHKPLVESISVGVGNLQNLFLISFISVLFRPIKSIKMFTF